MPIPVPYFRSSSYNCNDFCEQQYFGDYVLGWSGPSNMAADRGTIIHKVLEILANVKLANQAGKKIFHDKEVGTKVGMDCDIAKLTEKVFGYYVECERCSHHNWSEKDYKECLKLTNKALDYNDGMFDPRKRDVFAAEPHFDFEIQQPWAMWEHEGKSGFLAIKGTIDLVTTIDEGVLEVIDWKSGRYRKNWATGEEKGYEQFRKDPQLMMYY